MPLTDRPQLQPHDPETEQAILGAVLFDPSTLARAQERLAPSDFYDSRHRRIFEAMTELVGRSVGVDFLTVGNFLEQQGTLQMIGGRGTLAKLITTVPSATNLESHCRIVRDHAIRRQVIHYAATISQRAYEKSSAGELMQEAERELSQIASGRDKRSWCQLEELVRETVEHVDQVSKCGQTLTGIPTGYREFDALFSGWQRADEIIIAGRPGMGKTSLAIGSALAAAKKGYRVGFVSMEMSRLQVGLRLHGMQAPIDMHALRNGSITPQGWRLFANTAQELAPLPLWVDDSGVLTVEHIAAKARHLRARNGLDLLVVDYLQLLQLHDAETRQQGVADASRKFKLLAKELNIPVLILSQLSRACEQRTDHRPILADIRDSGAIEQDADVVLFLYREEVYTPDTEEKGIAEVLIRKHRNGPIGDLRMKFVDRFSRFEDLDEARG